MVNGIGKSSFFFFQCLFFSVLYFLASPKWARRELGKIWAMRGVEGRRGGHFHNQFKKDP